MIWKKRDVCLFIVFCLIMALISIYPYWFNGVNLEHDTCFHLSRIEGLAQSFKDGILIPRIYPYKNLGFGYASPTFYSDFFLVVPALLTNAGVSLARSYQILLFICSFFTCWFMGTLTKRLCKNKEAVYLTSFLYLFCSYRLTDIYVRGALGEVIAFVFLPAALLGMIEVLWKDEKRWGWLVFGFTGLLLSHNITFILGCFLFICLIVIYFHNLWYKKQRLMAVFKAILLTLGISSFFLFPMLEQLMSQKYYLHYYGTSSNLEAYALNAWQFTEQRMIFGISGNALNPDQIMSTNLGWLIPLLPCLSFFLFKDKCNENTQFLHWCMILGYSYFFLCSRLFPWKYASFLRILQFPWRFMGLASLLLSLCGGIIAVQFFNKKRRISTCIIILSGLITGVWQLTGVSDRPLMYSLNEPYTDLINGTLIDPYYGDSFYVRPEIAGADYLPVSVTDYRTASVCATAENGIDQFCDIKKQGTVTTFSVPEGLSPQWLTVPVTWYKGYTGYKITNGGVRESLAVDADLDKRLVKIYYDGGPASEISVSYTGTFIQKISEIISLITIMIWILKNKFRIIIKKRSY